jgi:hypothetical protein
LGSTLVGRVFAARSCSFGRATCAKICEALPPPNTHARSATYRVLPSD